jgi:hypothetical protein
MDWEPIRRIGVTVLGVDHLASGMLEVRIDLDPVPDDDWNGLFDRPTVSMPLSMHPPQLREPGTVYIRPPDEELKKYVEHVDERIASANRRYETEVIPRRLSADERERAEAEALTARLAEAQRRAKEL